MSNKVSNTSLISDKRPDSKPLVIVFPGVSVPPGSTAYFLSKHVLKSIEALDETFEQMAEFVKQSEPSIVIAIVPKRFRLDILAYLNGIVDKIEFLDEP